MADEKIRVAVLGAAGRMGTTVCRAVLDAPDMELVAVIDPPHEGRPLDDFGVAGTGLVLSMLGPQVKAAEPSGRTVILLIGVCGSVDTTGTMTRSARISTMTRCSQSAPRVAVR